ncbi:hypothetical protein [Flavobacterium sp.]|uniref:hypothetical protein n=1 Tax=Flavobacterium sp. TaxID=239 RepID=UPI00121ECD48|nr:hypothetical protein [Flavobacterium sp.]RZJ71968.1 MAG: hypothetical protein EOO49_08025 [Flavobacterium sp.]
MKLRLAAVLVLAITLFSCKNDKTTTDPAAAPETQEKKDDFFRVTFDLIVQKDDNFHLYYSLDGSSNFTEDMSVWMPVKGSDKVQQVTFTLPEDVIPSLMRVDFGFGKNEAQSDVDLKTFTMSYKGKEVTAAGQNIFTYFQPFESYTVVAPGTTVLKRLKKDQTTGPILYPLSPQTDKINEITAGEAPE